MYSNLYSPSSMNPNLKNDGSFSEVIHIEPCEILNGELLNILSTVPEKEHGIIKAEFDSFIKVFKEYELKSDRAIDWSKIQLIPDSEIIKMKNLKSVTEPECKQLLDNLVVLKLNGGLGTSMGCVGPKSVIQVRDDKSFLDITVLQIETLNNKYKSDVPLVLMNSFNTDNDTKKILNRYKKSNVKIYTFMQRKFPRIIKDTFIPLAKSYTPFNTEEWYPPGHGDIYFSFFISGLLDLFLQMGKSWLFISNVDNLGSTVELTILKDLLGQNKIDFVMEVTQKTHSDIKGGTLIKYNDKTTLLEVAQVPKDKMDEFTSIQKFNIFNTNNLWIKLDKMRDLVVKDAISMEIIVNPKTLANDITIIQLEQAAGAAIRSFDNGVGLLVPRSRFLPVKTTSDLLVLKSNLYDLFDGELKVSPQRKFPTLPFIKLGPHFKSVKQFIERFPKFPDLIQLNHLTVCGDVKFTGEISLRGTVIIIAQESDHIDIPNGSILENKVVTGNLRILDH